MTLRRFIGIACATIVTALGLSFLWTAVYFIFDWVLLWPVPSAPGADGDAVLLPIVGFIAFWYLLHLGLGPALFILAALGIGISVLGVIIFRRAR
jgi:hypothetical protein